jgi:predicted nucleotidyltransferase
MFVMYTADRVIATLRAHEAELRQAGLRSLSLFGSVARGETETDSDIDLAAEFDSAARMDLLQLIALERRITALLGSPVDLLPEPVEKTPLAGSDQPGPQACLLSMILPRPTTDPIPFSKGWTPPRARKSP